MLADEKRGWPPVLDAQQDALRPLHHAQSFGERRARARQGGKEKRVPTSEGDQRWNSCGSAAQRGERILRSEYALKRLEKGSRTLRLL